jgi:hypothetical protein
MNKIITTLFILFCALTSFGQGLEDVIVEKYYVSDASDAAGSSGILPVGSVTYRVYIDLFPGYNFQALYGVTGHTMSVATTTTFFNNEDYGNTSPNSISATNVRKNTTMLDSWFSVGATCNGKLGVLKDEDTDGSVGNANSLLLNADPTAGIPVSANDGMIPGTPLAVTFVGLNNTGNGDLAVFDGISQTGNLFTTDNGSVAALGGVTGPTATNRVLVGQFTTDGDLSFELNVQIGTPSGGVEQYVASNPTAGEIQFGALTYNSASTSIQDQLETRSAVTVYPNPTSGVIYLQLNKDMATSMTYQVHNISGAAIEPARIVDQSTSMRDRIDLSLQPAGVYFINYTSGTESGVVKFVKF